MAYAQLTFATAKADLARRLRDTSKVFWVDAELGTLITEALRTWNALTGHDRTRTGSVQVAAGDEFIDLPAAFPTERGYTVRDRSLIEEIQYHLVESVNASAWAGTEQFDLTMISEALTRRLNQFISETAIRVTEDSIDFLTPPDNGRVTLDPDVIDVRRAVWVTPEGNHIPLRRSDEFGMSTMNPGWATGLGTPISYSIVTTPNQQLQLSPIPQDRGTLELLVTRSEDTLDPTANDGAGTLLNIPDDLAWVIKWGALADLMGSDGPAYDPPRAWFAESIYQLGVVAANNAPSVLLGYLNSVATIPDTVHSIDAMSPRWQNSNGKPRAIGVASPDLVAIVPPPSTRFTTALSFELVRKMTVPTADSHFLQVGREIYEAIISWAQFLAAFKEAGYEHTSARRGAKLFLEQAAHYNSRLSAASTFRGVMQRLGQQDEIASPHVAAEVEPERIEVEGSRGGE